MGGHHEIHLALLLVPPKMDPTALRNHMGLQSFENDMFPKLSAIRGAKLVPARLQETNPVSNP